MRKLGQNMHYLSSLVKVCPKEVNDSLKVTNQINFINTNLVFQSELQLLLRDVLGIHTFTTKLVLILSA